MANTNGGTPNQSGNSPSGSGGGSGTPDYGSIFGSAEAIDPSTAGSDTGGSDSGSGTSGYTGKRRGRKPGAKNRTKETPSLEGIEKLLLSIHAIGSTIIPELALDPTEAKTLAEGMAGVSRHYSNAAFSEKTLDWLNLLMCVGMVYGTRIAAIKIRMRAEAANKEDTITTPQGTVHPFRQPHAG